MSDFLPIDCPNCGDTVDIAIAELQLLHNGMTIICPACDCDITFTLTGDSQEPDDLVKLTEFEYLDGKVRFELAGQAVHALAGWMAYWFQESGGKNYVELSMYHEDTGPLIFTVQRMHGQTPHQLREEAEQLLDEAGDVLREWPLGHSLREKAMAIYFRIVER